MHKITEACPVLSAVMPAPSAPSTITQTLSECHGVLTDIFNAMHHIQYRLTGCQQGQEKDSAEATVCSVELLSGRLMTRLVDLHTLANQIASKV